MKISRREFVHTSMIGLIGAPAVIGSKPRIFKTALIGSGWWGMNILQTALSANRSNAVSLCDVDQTQVAKAALKVENLSGNKPSIYGDFSKLRYPRIQKVKNQ